MASSVFNSGVFLSRFCIYDLSSPFHFTHSGLHHDSDEPTRPRSPSRALDFSSDFRQNRRRSDRDMRRKLQSSRQMELSVRDCSIHGPGRCLGSSLPLSLGHLFAAVRLTCNPAYPFHGFDPLYFHSPVVANSISRRMPASGALPPRRRTFLLPPNSPVSEKHPPRTEEHPRGTTSRVAHPSPDVSRSKGRNWKLQAGRYNLYLPAYHTSACAVRSPAGARRRVRNPA